MRLFILGLLSLSVMISCKKDTNTVTTTPPTTSNDTVSNSMVIQGNDLNSITAFLITEKKEVMSQLQNADTKKADKLFVMFCDAVDSAMVKLNNSEADLLGNFYSNYYKDGEARPSEALLLKRNKLNSAGLEFVEGGEGDATIHPVPDFYSSIFRDYVSAGYKEFIRLKASDDRKPFAADAAIIIPLSELGERVYNWEQFITKFPENDTAVKARKTYLMYQFAFLFGLDNTPAYDGSGRLYPDNEKEMKAYTARHPQGFTTELIQTVLSNNGNLHQLNINKMQKEYLSKL